MHIKWDVPKGFVHRFRDRLSVFFLYTFRNQQRTARGSRVQNREIESENPYDVVTKMVTKLEEILPW